MADITVSGTTDPSNYQSYTVEANDKNTLTMTDYFQLLAAQLRNQDVTNPMDNSEMMAQMVQMGMMQAMNAMTESMEANTATTAQTYAGSLLGQDVTVMVTTEIGGTEVPTGVKYGKVEYVSFVNGDIKFKLEGDLKEYTMSYMVGVGKIPDPFADKEDSSGEEDGDKVEGGTGDSKEPGNTTGGTEGTKDPSDAASGTEGTKEPTDAATETAGAGAGAEGTQTTPDDEVPKAAEEGAAAAAGVTP